MIWKMESIAGIQHSRVSACLHTDTYPCTSQVVFRYRNDFPGYGTTVHSRDLISYPLLVNKDCTLISKAAMTGGQGKAMFR